MTEPNPMGRADGRKQEARRRRRKRLAITLSVTLALLLALGAGVGVLWAQYGERISLAMGWTSIDYEGEGHGEAVITIRSGDIGQDVARALADAGVVKTSQAFYELLLAQDEEVQFHPGTFRLKLEMSAQAALDALQNPENRIQLKAVIPEGKTVEQTLELVSAGAEIPLEELQAAVADPTRYGVPAGVPSLEGWLHPATYEFEPNTTAEEAIAKLVGYQIAMLDKLGVAQEDRERVLTIASIVQREAGRLEDFGKVSRVVYNRLDAGMRLEMDSTAQYGMGQHDDGSVWSSKEALADDNPWNTYVHTGLPIGPIANPGLAAVEATLSPEPGDWFYFVAINLETGESQFSRTYAEHRAATQKLYQWCAANPQANC